MNVKTIILILILSLSCLLSATIWEINQDGTGDFVNIQEGIDAATDGDTVLVHPGTYYENINFLGKDITVASLILITGDESYIYNTIIDGNEEWSVVEFISDETEAATLQGFTITNGISYAGFGGGIYIDYSSPSLKDLLVKNNYAQAGGGIYFSSSEANLENVTITQNHAYRVGGGIAIAKSLGQNPPDSQIHFNTENKCNIYNNTAAICADVFLTNVINFTTHNHVVVDTFTVFDPCGDYVNPSPYLTISIDNQWLEPAEYDLYVHPEGDDNNSGATPDDPLRCIQWALSKIGSNSPVQRTIHLAEGIYSFEQGQLFPLNLRTNVTLKGEGKNKTILEGSSGTNTPIRWFVRTGYYNDNIEIKDMTFRNDNSSRFYDSLSLYEAANAKVLGISIYNINGNFSGVSLTRGNLILKDSEIYDNKSRFFAVRLHNASYSPETYGIFENLTIMNTIPDVTVWGGGGAALLVQGTNNVTISNCLIANNTPFEDMFPRGTVHLSTYDLLYFTNNTVVNNNTIPGTFVPCGAFFLGGGVDLYLTNNIIYDNSDYTFILARSETPSTVYMEHNLIEGGNDPTIIFTGTGSYTPELIWGEGNIDGPVHFYGEAAGLDPSDPLYYQLTENSPAVDAGTPDTTGLHLPPWDLLYNLRVWDGLGNGEAIIDIGCYEYGAPPYPQSAVSADEPAIEIPQQLSVKNYPNPFNPDTIIKFELPQESDVTLEIFNIKGQKVRKLYDCFSPPGIYSLHWNGKDDNGRQLPSGIYLYKLVTEYEVVTRKMMLLK